MEDFDLTEENKILKIQRENFDILKYNNLSDDKKYIEDKLKLCYKFKYNNSIYYITSENIVRQLKYNNILNYNKEINFDINKLTFDNVILRQDLKYKKFYINYEMWYYLFDRNFTMFFDKYITDILLDVSNLNKIAYYKYITSYYSEYDLLYKNKNVIQ